MRSEVAEPLRHDLARLRAGSYGEVKLRVEAVLGHGFFALWRRRR